MLSNYYTLIHVSRFLDKFCSHRAISEIYSQQPDELCIVTGADNEAWTIVVSCVPSENYIYARKGYFRAKKNSLDLLKEAVQRTITDIQIEKNDRVVIVNLDHDATLRLEMFGSKANVLHCRQSSKPEAATVTDSFLRKKELVGKELPVRTIGKETACDENAFFENARSESSGTIVQVLKKMFPLLGSRLANEVLYRSQVGSSEMVKSLDDVSLRKIYTGTRQIIEDVSRPEVIEPRIYMDGRIPLCMSLVPLRTFEQYGSEVFPDVCSAIFRFAARSKSSALFTQEKQSIVQRIERERRKAEGTLSKIKNGNHAADRAAELEMLGKLLMANLHALHKGMKKAEVRNSLSSGGGEIVSIPLDPALSPIQNAERYFEKAKKLKSTQDETAHRNEDLTRELRTAEALLEDIEEVHDKVTLDSYLLSHEGQLRSLGFKTSKEESEVSPFRTFVVDGGFLVLVGKNSANNDLLTTKHAKPNDLWFHCRGASGSHVVLKVGSGHGEPGKTAITQAASLAAYYSKMKNASLVPVAMTEKKYVRKPKGAAAGTVAIEREKVLIVPPRLPQESTGKN
jgi:predicted ribosome quality control (RQC) complex YloA/Tae2 family protein